MLKHSSCLDWILNLENLYLRLKCKWVYYFANYTKVAYCYYLNLKNGTHLFIYKNVIMACFFRSNQKFNKMTVSNDSIVFQYNCSKFGFIWVQALFQYLSYFNLVLTSEFYNWVCNSLTPRAGFLCLIKVLCSKSKVSHSLLHIMVNLNCEMNNSLHSIN